MKKIALLLLIIVAACSKPEPTFFNHDGVSFSMPGDWKISEQQPIEEIGYYIAAQKDGFSSSGLFTLTWVKGDLDLAGNIKIYQEEMQNNVVYKSSNLAFTEVKPSKFAGHETLASDFSAKIISVQHRGTIHAFLHNGVTYTVLVQEANDDEDDNKEGFELIEKTFKVK